VAVRFGIAVPQSTAGADGFVADGERFVRAAESAGLDSLWVQEQLLGSDPSVEPVVHLSHVAALTSRIRLGTAAIIAPVRNPVVLAKQLASVDRLSGGRLTVGLALGDMPALYTASGVPHGERVARLERFVSVAKDVWTSGEVTYDDGALRLDRAPMAPVPVQRPHPPVWFGAHSAPALDRALRLGSGWIGAGGATVEDFARLAARVAAARAARTAPSGFTVSKKMYLHVGSDRQAARDALLDWFRVHWGGESGVSLGQRVGLAGTPQDVARDLATVARAGAELIICNPVRDELEQLELLTQSVIPMALEILGDDA